MNPKEQAPRETLAGRGAMLAAGTLQEKRREADGQPGG